MRVLLWAVVCAFLFLQCAARAGAVATGDAERKVPVSAIKEHRSGEWSPGLTDDEKRTVFQIARDSLSWSLGGGRGKFAFDKYDLTPGLKEKAAVFVTYLNRGNLRGCIGILEAREPLYMAVHEYAVHASRDYRFATDPIVPAEVPAITIHVSILSAMRDIPSLAEFRIGEHGIVLCKGMRQAVYLPEVAVEQGWTKEQTLTSLSRKAGLPGDAWREGASFKVFSSVVLAEE
jgi:AmmeMemoRadiSam system protein A